MDGQAVVDDGFHTSKPSRLHVFWRRVIRYPATLFGFGIVIFFLFTAIFGPLLSPYGYSEQITHNRLARPSAEHFFGTDQFGRDILSRILVGSRDVYLVAGTGTLLAVILGLSIGLTSSYYGGLLDELIMRVMDVLLSMPPLLLAMVMLGTIGPSRVNVILIVGILYLPTVARVVRSVVLDLKTREFVEAAKLRGEDGFYIMFREILPNLLPPLAVESSIRFSYAIFLVASLGFLGLGVQPPAPDWGLMVNEARDWFDQASWVLFFPAGAIVLLVVGVSFASDGLRRLMLPSDTSE